MFLDIGNARVPQKNLIDTLLHKGGTMVPNIWFFGSRILTPQYFGLIIVIVA